MKWGSLWPGTTRHDRGRQHSALPGRAPDASAAADPLAEPVREILDQARQAEQRADWPAAEAHWRAAIARDEHLVLAHTGLAKALRRQDRPAEAEAVLLRACNELPPDLDPLVAYAELAAQRRDWEAAEQRWQTARMCFPDIWYSYAGGATAMRELGRPDQAEALLSDAAERFPWEPAIAQERGRLAASRSDWAAAEVHWRASLAQGAHPWWAYTELATALERQGKLVEAEAVLFEGQQQDPQEISLFSFHARLAGEQRDPVEAERRWRLVRGRFAERPEGYTEHADALRQLRRFDKAEAALLEAAARFPADAAVQQALAQLAEAKSDAATAAEHWRASLRINPDASWARKALAAALVRLGRSDEAETLLLTRQTSHPDDITGFIAHAELAEERRDWSMAQTRWHVVVRNFPDRPEGYEGVLRAMRERGRPADAAAILVEAMRRFPASAGIQLEAARLAHLSGHTGEALRGMAQVRRQLPRFVSGYTDAAEILRVTGRVAEAQELVTEAMTRFPNDWAVWRAAGLLTETREDWAGAVAHWIEMARRFPAMAEQSRLHEALMRFAEVDPIAADEAAWTQGIASASDMLRTLALSFESLGGCGPAGGCEFGFIQRALGAEPLGLLRWGFVDPEWLIRWLGNRFDGIGSPETTQVYLPGNDPEGWWDVRDTRGGLALHTFVPAKQVSHERMAVLTLRRLQYLRRKLIADLENPTKIFVLKAAERHLTQAELEALGRGIRSYGPGELLCVFASDAAHPAGAVEARSPGVRVGYMDFSSLEERDVRLPAWLALCRAILAA